MNNGKKEGRKKGNKQERREDGTRNEVHICVLVNRRK